MVSAGNRGQRALRLLRAGQKLRASAFHRGSIMTAFHSDVTALEDAINGCVGYKYLNWDIMAHFVLLLEGYNHAVFYCIVQIKQGEKKWKYD